MISTRSGSLPKEFSELEVWCEKWCLEGMKERNDQRHATPIDEIRDFYSAMLNRADDALEYLSALKLGDLNSEQTNLLRLLCSLAEVGPAVEWFGSERVVDGYDRHALHIREIPENVSQLG